MKGPAGYGRYDDDLTHVGCPWAKSDMTPCLARDGAVCLTDAPNRVCVGCGHPPRFLLADLADGYEPAAATAAAKATASALADALRDLVRQATDPERLRA